MLFAMGFVVCSTVTLLLAACLTFIAATCSVRVSLFAGTRNILGSALSYLVSDPIFTERGGATGSNTTKTYSSTQQSYHISPWITL
jgi:hypothetical protein